MVCIINDSKSESLRGRKYTNNKKCIPEYHEGRRMRYIRGIVRQRAARQKNNLLTLKPFTCVRKRNSPVCNPSG